MADPEVRGRSWRWFRTRVEGLLTRPVTVTPAGTVLCTSRVQELVVGPAEQDAIGA